MRGSVDCAGHVARHLGGLWCHVARPRSTLCMQRLCHATAASARGVGMRKHMQRMPRHAPRLCRPIVFTPAKPEPSNDKHDVDLGQGRRVEQGGRHLGDACRALEGTVLSTRRVRLLAAGRMLASVSGRKARATWRRALIGTVTQRLSEVRMCFGTTSQRFSDAEACLDRHEDAAPG
jgi:hypothetical protein